MIQTSRLPLFTLSRLVAVMSLMLAAFMLPASLAMAGQIERTFSQSDRNAAITIDHSAWTALLSAHIVPAESGLNRLDYKALKKRENYQQLAAYISKLEGVDVTRLNKNEQFAFWANLYNAKTVQIVLDHYPVKSIKDIDISGFFSNGPWGKKVTKVNGLNLSLNDIEHKILRGLWKDPRVHYSVNCASVGCPNLNREAFSGKTLDQQLNQAASHYINAPRGARIDARGRLIVSKIYSWFDEDFGNSPKGVIRHLKRFAKSPLKEGLARASSIYAYRYDWSLNDIKK